jgi:hypothetical protein
MAGCGPSPNGLGWMNCWTFGPESGSFQSQATLPSKAEQAGQRDPPGATGDAITNRTDGVNILFVFWNGMTPLLPLNAVNRF